MIKEGITTKTHSIVHSLQNKSGENGTYGYKTFRIFALPYKRGKVQEWFNWHAWKACVPETVPRVRIPLFPQNCRIRIGIRLFH